MGLSVLTAKKTRPAEAALIFIYELQDSKRL